MEKYVHFYCLTLLNSYASEPCQNSEKDKNSTYTLKLIVACLTPNNNSIAYKTHIHNWSNVCNVTESYHPYQAEQLDVKLELVSV